jgi:serine/threonine protein phosphatase PrpC
MAETGSVPWRAAGVSVPGARHLSNGTPCQDAVLTRVEAEMAIVAVADGHGDPKHARSHEGSQLAVEVVADLLAQLAKDVMDQPNPPHPLELESELRQHLPRRIAWEWNRRARLIAGQSNPDGTWHKDLTLFGTTLIGALFTRRFAVFYQLGDGDILYMSDDGCTEQVFAPSEELYGSLTWSMCMPDGSSKAQVAT